MMRRSVLRLDVGKKCCLPTRFLSQRTMATVQPASQTFDIKRISGSLGAEIHGVDLRTLDSSAVQKIRQAWLDHKVIFFRNQTLTPESFLKFSAQFGEAIEYPFVKGIDGYPTVIEVLKREHEHTNFGGVWQ